MRLPLGKPSQPGLVFYGKARAHPSVKYLSSAPLLGWLLALLTNIRLGLKG